MRILVIANIYPYEVGGAQTQVRNLVNNWALQGHMVTVAGNRIPTETITVDSASKSFSCIHVPTITRNKLTRAISYSLSLSYYILSSRKQFDIIYCRFLQEAALIISLLKLAHLTALPLITCPACSGDQGDAKFLKAFPFSKFFNAILKQNCDIINIISPAIASELTQIGFDKSRFSHIPNGVTIQPLNRKLDSHHDDKSLIFVGRLTEQKGVSFLINALHILAKPNNFKQLTIIGDGPEKDALTELATDLGLKEKICFMGTIKHDEIHTQLSKHDIFILPSLNEGHPNALLEAMTTGLPAIVTKCGGSEFFIDNSTGRVVPAGDINSLAEAIDEFLQLTNEQLHQMGIVASEQIKNKYNIEVTANSYIDLFSQHI